MVRAGDFKMLKYLALILLAVSLASEARIQLFDGPMGVGDRVKPDASVLLHLRSTTQGFKVPQLTTVQRDAIVSPIIGLEIFNSDNNQKEFFDGLVWSGVGTGNSFFQVTQAAHGRTIGSAFIPVFLISTIWTDAKADSNLTLGTHVIVQVIDANTFVVAQTGRYTITAHGLTIERFHFVSELTAGVFTLTEPPVFSNPLIFVEDANIIHVTPFRASSSTGVGPGFVTAVFGRTAAVVAVTGDYTGSQVLNVPAGDISATSTQAAIDELDAEKQPLNSELSGIGGLSSNGIVARTGAGTYASRTLSASSSKVLIVDGDGVAGNPLIDVDETQVDHNNLLNFLAVEHENWTSATLNFLTTGTLASGTSTVTGDILVSGLVDGRDISLDGSKLDGVESLADVTDSANVAAAGAVMDTDFGSNGLMVRTALGSYASRTLTASTTKIVVTDGDGVAGNPTIDVDESQIDHDSLLNFVTNEHIDHSSILLDVSASNDGISGGGDWTVTRNLLIDINSLASEGVIAGVDEFMMFDISANDLKKVTATTLQGFFGGEANTASNSGGGEGIFIAKSGVNLPFKSLIGGSNVSVTSTATEITINATVGETNTASNLAGGVGIFESKVGSDLRFHSLSAGVNVTIVDSGNFLTIAASGEANTGSSLGGTEAVFAGKNLIDLEFKGLTAGAGITLTPTANDITIATTGVVTSVFGRTADVVAVVGDYTGSQVLNVPAGNISATSTQAAIDELDTEKEPVIVGGASTITSADLTIDRALISNGLGKVIAATTTATEVSFLEGVTSNIQTQFDNLDRGQFVQGGILHIHGATSTPLLINATDEVIDLSTTVVTDGTFYTVDGGNDEVQLNTAGRYRISYTITAFAIGSATYRTVDCDIEENSGGPFVAILKSNMLTNIRSTRHQTQTAMFTESFAINDDIRLVCQADTQATNTEIRNTNILIEFLGP